MIGPRPGGLLRRLLLFILLFSLCFTVLASAVQLYFEYRREMRDIDTRLELIRVGYLASFERSLWDEYDGTPAGAGYRCTQAGFDFFTAHLDNSQKQADAHA